MKITTRSILIGVSIIIAIWLTSWILITQLIPTTERGTFGDMFGAVNALFSGLALFGIVMSILIQQSELKLQQKELAETREEFKVNRLTNILFKQIEYLNTVIENTKFIEGTISETKEILDHYSKSDEASFLEILERNSHQIGSLTTNVVSILENFDDLLDKSKIDKKEILQMKNFFKRNINPFFIDLILHDLKTIKKPSSADIDLKEIETQIVKLHLQRVTYIIEYGKEED